MDIILNEKDFAIQTIKNKCLGNKPSATLNILARYYREEGCSDDEIFDNLRAFLHSCLGSEYNEAKWIECVNYQVNNSKKYKLVQIDKIDITESELMTIENNVELPRLRRLAFTLLVLAKYHNAIYEKNNDWVNEPIKRIFQLASIVLTTNNQLLMLNDLITAGLIDTSKRVDSLNLCVTFIDDTSPMVVSITDMREIGKEYMLCNGANYKRCEKCRVLFKPNAYNHKYCSKCGKYQSIRVKTVVCSDCGTEFEVDGNVNHKKRCDECQKIYRNEYQRELMKKKRCC